MIEWQDIRLNLKGQPVLRGFDLTPAPGKLNLLIGSNDAGKLPQSPVFHPRLRVRELLLFYARLEGVDHRQSPRHRS